jgi:hypothetical protein
VYNAGCKEKLRTKGGKIAEKLKFDVSENENHKETV